MLVYVCICMHVYVCMYMYVCIYMYVCVCIHVYVCMHNILGELSGECPTQNGRGNCPGELSYTHVIYCFSLIINIIKAPLYFSFCDGQIVYVLKITRFTGARLFGIRTFH